MKRRGFLGMMAASPFAAKEIASNKIMDMAGARIAGPENLAYSVGQSAAVLDDPNNNILSKVKDYLLNKGIPAFKLDELKRGAKVVDRINPNIGCLSSVSMSHKVRMQQAQNFEDRKEYFLHDYKNSFGADREKFQKEMKWYL